MCVIIAAALQVLIVKIAIGCEAVPIVKAVNKYGGRYAGIVH